LRILITNDDGIFAPGLLALYESIKDLGDIFICAPDSEKSAVGHGITLHHPLRIKKVDTISGCKNAYAVNGTPVDCVKIAIKCLMDKKPDLVLSGINLGENTGINIIYSGTIAGAVEGAILGIPSMAFSLTTYVDPNFEVSANFVRLAVKLFAQKIFNIHNLLLSINIPKGSLDEIKDVVLTHQGKTEFIEAFDKREDPSGKIYYWLNGSKIEKNYHPDSDEHVIRDKKISITPLQFDLTDHSFFKEKPSLRPEIEKNTFLAFVEELKESFRKEKIRKN